MQTRTIHTKLVWMSALLVCTALTACHPKSIHQAKADMMAGGAHISAVEPIDEPVTIVSKLDCPDEQGELKRTSQASDGHSCAYSSDRGVVELQLMTAPGGDAEATLAPIKAGIDAMLPHQASGATVAVSSEKIGGRDVSKVDMPFIHVSDDGHRSHVRVFGINIDADNDSNKTGDAGKTAQGNEYVYVLAGSPPSSDGYHAVGYVARSDTGGKVVVATFKYRNGDKFFRSGHDDHDSDLNALLDLNAKKD